MSKYVLKLVIDGIDNASGAIGNVGSALAGLGKFALGGAIAGAAAGIGGLVASIKEAADSQDAIAGLDAVLQATGAAAQKQAADYAAAASKNITTTALSKDALAQLNQQLTDSQLQYNTLTASMQEQKQRVIDLTARYGDNGLATITAKNKLAQMENEANKLSGTMDELSSKIAKGSQVIHTTLAQQLGLTAPAAQMSRDALLDLASAMQKETRFSDESVMGAEKIMLTFRSVGKEVFPDAIKSAADLSTVMGVDLQSASVMLGKALNDPVQGITALRRVGVSFSDQQEEQIKKLVKQGKLLEAQKIILGEVSAEMGGAAVAAGKTWNGQLDILKNQFSDLLETIGGPFLPILQNAASGLIAFLGNPQIQAGVAQFAQQFATGLSSAVQQGIGFIQTVAIPALQKLSDWFFAVGLPALQAFAAQAGPFLQNALAQGIAFIQGVAIPALQTFGNWILTSLVPALVQFGGFLQANVLPYVIQFGTWLGGTILSGAQQLGSWLMGSLVPALVQMATTIGTAAMPYLQMFGDWLVTTAIPALQQFANFVGPILQQAFSFLGTYIVGTLIPQFTTWAQYMLTKAIPAFAEFAGEVGGAVNGALAQLGPLWAGITSNFQKAVTFVSDTTKNFGALADTIQKNLAPVVQWFNTTILEPLRQTFDALVGLAKGFFEWLQKIADMLANLQIPDFLQRHSPSPLEQALMNSNAYLRDMASLAPSAFGAYRWMGMPAPITPSVNVPSGGNEGTNAGGARPMIFNGHIYVTPHNYDDFVRQLNERVSVEQRFVSFAE